MIFYNKITESQMSLLYEEQGGRCLICNDAKEELVVDHDHETGIVRGLLCRSCNMAIGLLREDPATVRRAASYIADSRIRIQSEYVLEQRTEMLFPKDWRQLEPMLTYEQTIEIAQLTPAKVRLWANKIGVSEKTITNWRASANAKLENMK